MYCYALLCSAMLATLSDKPCHVTSCSHPSPAFLFACRRIRQVSTFIRSSFLVPQLLPFPASSISMSIPACEHSSSGINPNHSAHRMSLAMLPLQRVLLILILLMIMRGLSAVRRVGPDMAISCFSKQYSSSSSS